MNVFNNFDICNLALNANTTSCYQLCTNILEHTNALGFTSLLKVQSFNGSSGKEWNIYNSYIGALKAYCRQGCYNIDGICIQSPSSNNGFLQIALLFSLMSSTIGLVFCTISLSHGNHINRSYKTDFIGGIIGAFSTLKILLAIFQPFAVEEGFEELNTYNATLKSILLLISAM